MRQRELFPKIRSNVQETLGGYLKMTAILEKVEDYIVPPGLDEKPVVSGALPWLKQLLQCDFNLKVGKMSAKEEHLREEMHKLRELLRERESALPAHSVRPQHIQEIEELEEKIAVIKKELEEMPEH